MVCSERIVCWAIKRIGGGTGTYMYVSEEREMDKRRDREHGGKHGRIWAGKHDKMKDEAQVGQQDEMQAEKQPGLQDGAQAGEQSGLQDEAQAGEQPGLQDEAQAEEQPGLQDEMRDEKQDEMLDEILNDKKGRREIRRKRRIRNQLVAYVVLSLLLLGAALCVVAGVRKLSAIREEKEQQESQDKINELRSAEPPIATPAPTPEPAGPTPQEMLDEIVNEVIAVMPLEDKVAGLFIVTPEAITKVSTAVRAGESTQKALSQYAVGGLVYFAKNIQSKEQLTEMLANTKKYSKYPIFLAVDEEGGKVARVGNAGLGPKFDNAQKIGATGDVGNARQAGVSIGQALAGLGFNLDFAPVADVANVSGSVMAERSYGSDAATVSGFVTAMMGGLEEQKVTACLKHFPGIGSTTADTHKGLAFTDRTAEQFRAEELAVFKAGIDAGANMIMVGHMSAPALTGNNDPCIFSQELVTGILREELGFEGVIITDAMNMKAISEYYGAEEAAIMALKAGCDMLLMPEDFEKAYKGVLQAVADGVISEERINDSLRRVYRIKEADKIQE